MVGGGWSGTLHEVITNLYIFPYTLFSIIHTKYPPKQNLLTPETMTEKVSVLFVCLGNICRSTMSEGVFQSLAQTEPYTDLIDRIDSCGTGAYHVGDSPDRRTMATLKAKGVKGYKHAARQVLPPSL